MRDECILELAIVLIGSERPSNRFNNYQEACP